LIFEGADDACPQAKDAQKSANASSGRRAQGLDSSPTKLLFLRRLVRDHCRGQALCREHHGALRLPGGFHLPPLPGGNQPGRSRPWIPHTLHLRAATGASSHVLCCRSVPCHLTSVVNRGRSSQSKVAPGSAHDHGGFGR